MTNMIKDLLRSVFSVDIAILTRGAQLLVVLLYWLYLAWRDSRWDEN